MEKTPTNVQFDSVFTHVELDTKENVIRCFKDFCKDGKQIHSDQQKFDLRVLNFSVAMQMACAYVQSSTLTKYE